MAALSLTVPTRLGTLSPPNSVSASDTIAPGLIGRGVYLDIINAGAGVDNITISDAGATLAGTPLASGNYSGSVTNATAKTFYISPSQADPVNGVTITHSQPTGVTYKLYPASA